MRGKLASSWTSTTFEDGADHVFDEVLHVALAHEGEFHVQLGELQLAVGTQCFVAEAARDLVVTVEAGHHQDLLEQLRALRQRVELARCMRAGTRKSRAPSGVALVRIGVSMSWKPFSSRWRRRACTSLMRVLHALHFRTAQVQIAVLQAGFARVLVGVERQRRSLVQHGDGGGDHFHLPVRILSFTAWRARRPHLQHVLVAQRSGHGEHFGVVDLHGHLHDAFMIAEIDEADAALVTGHVGPTGEGDSLANQVSSTRPQKGTHWGSRWRTPAPDGAGKPRILRPRPRPGQIRPVTPA